MTDPTPARAPEREQKPARRCIDCGLVELPDRYPFTTCEDCWDRKYPPKANFAFDFAKPPPAASVREDEVVVRREDATAATLALYRAYEASYSPAEQSWLLHAHERITAALTTAPESSGTSQDGEGT